MKMQGNHIPSSQSMKNFILPKKYNINHKISIASKVNKIDAFEQKIMHITMLIRFITKILLTYSLSVLLKTAVC